MLSAADIVRRVITRKTFWTCQSPVEIDPEAYVSKNEIGS